MAQTFPLLLVIRNSEAEVRWMEMHDWLNDCGVLAECFFTG